MIQKLFYKTTSSIASAAFLIGAASLLSRLLGIARDRIFASQFGAGHVLDAYYAAFRIPDFLFNLIVLGALSAGFIPIFSEYINSKKESDAKEAWNLVNGLFQWLIIILLVLCAIIFIFADPLLGFITPGFDSSTLHLSIQMTRVMLLSPILLGVSSLFGGILQTYKNFVAYSLAPVLYNLGIILGALLLVPHFGSTGLAWGVILGAALHMLVQLPPAVKAGFRVHPFQNLRHPGLKELARLMIPRTMTLGVTQLNFFVITIIASTLAVGSLTIFNLANNLQYFPVGIFGISFAIAAFPTLSEFWGKDENTKYFHYLYGTLKQIALLLIPVTALIVLIDEQIVRLVLGAGAFDLNATKSTSLTLSYFVISAFFQGSIPLFVRAFYAQKNTKFPLYAAAFAMILNMALSYWFSSLYGVAGLGLAFSIASIVQFVILFIGLKVSLTQVLPSLLRISLATTVTYFFVQYFKVRIGPHFDFTTFMNVLLNTSIIVIVFTALFSLFARLFQVEEFDELLNSLHARISRTWQSMMKSNAMEGVSEDTMKH